MFRSFFCCATIVAVVNSLQMEDPAAAAIATAAAEHLARPQAHAETASWAHAASHTDSQSRSDSAGIGSFFGGKELTDEEKKKACDDIGYGKTDERPKGWTSIRSYKDQCIRANPCCVWMNIERND